MGLAPKKYGNGKYLGTYFAKIYIYLTAFGGNEKSDIVNANKKPIVLRL